MLRGNCTLNAFQTAGLDRLNKFLRFVTWQDEFYKALWICSKNVEELGVTLETKKINIRKKYFEDLSVGRQKRQTEKGKK
jgi:hypothetical protein